MHANAPAPAPDEIRALVAPLTGLEGPLLPMLHALQREYGFVPQDAVPVLADLLIWDGRKCMASSASTTIFATRLPGGMC